MKLQRRTSLSFFLRHSVHIQFIQGQFDKNPLLQMYLKLLMHCSSTSCPAISFYQSHHFFHALPNIYEHDWHSAADSCSMLAHHWFDLLVICHVKQVHNKSEQWSLSINSGVNQSRCTLQPNRRCHRCATVTTT